MSGPTPGPEFTVRELLQRIPGVLCIEEISAEDRSKLVGLATPLAAENRGVGEALTREHVLCLFKTRSFRGPTEPTLVMMDEEGTLLGRELLGPWDRPAAGERPTVYLGRDFVLVASVRPKGRVRFVLPPVRFPELEGIPGVRDVVSGSPDPPQDEALRNRFHMEGGKDLASILVGYNVVAPTAGASGGSTA